MPYIIDKDRQKIVESDYIGQLKLVCDNIDTAGELQYAMALMFKSYVNRVGLKYQTCNDVMGALAGAQMEFYRKVVGPYEEKKESENGGVY